MSQLNRLSLLREEMRRSNAAAIESSKQRNKESRPPESRTRITSDAVLRNLELFSLSWQSHRLEIAADAAIGAGIIDVLPDRSLPPVQLIAAALLTVGDEYAAGFRDGFDCARPGPKRTARYVHGMEDGKVVGRTLRHYNEERAE